MEIKAENVSDNSDFMEGILQNNPAFFKDILAHKDSMHVQIIYTRIDRDASNIPHFTEYRFNTDNGSYFYPASTVKFPVSLLALEKVNELASYGINKFSPVIHYKMDNDTIPLNPISTSAGNKPSIADYIKQILLVSDNEAFNRLYEFLGQEYIQKKLAAKGYPDLEIRHRLQVALTEAENRHTNALTFFDANGQPLYYQASAESKAIFSYRNTFMGKGFIRNDSLVNEPFDLSSKNRMYLTDLTLILRSILFPEATEGKQRFNLSDEDYHFLYRYMSAYPKESNSPVYDTAEYHDTYVKFLLYGNEKVKVPSNIRIFNKVGDAYGFLTDAAYIVDFKNKIEFMLSATIYCNKDGIFNDDAYDYDSVGYPFMKHLGQVLYNYELTRPRAFKPDLSKFKMNYKKD